MFYIVRTFAFVWDDMSGILIKKNILLFALIVKIIYTEKKIECGKPLVPA